MCGVTLFIRVAVSKHNYLCMQRLEDFNYNHIYISGRGNSYTDCMVRQLMLRAERGKYFRNKINYVIACNKIGELICTAIYSGICLIK